jgi:hypothetical protein
MSPTIVREAKNSVQISENGLFVFFNKGIIKTGSNTGKPIYTVNINKYDAEEATHFLKIATLFLDPANFDEFLALLVQLQKRK